MRVLLYGFVASLTIAGCGSRSEPSSIPVLPSLPETEALSFGTSASWTERPINQGRPLAPAASAELISTTAYIVVGPIDQLIAAGLRAAEDDASRPRRLARARWDRLVSTTPEEWHEDGDRYHDGRLHVVRYPSMTATPGQDMSCKFCSQYAFVADYVFTNDGLSAPDPRIELSTYGDVIEIKADAHAGEAILIEVRARSDRFLGIEKRRFYHQRFSGRGERVIGAWYEWEEPRMLHGEAHLYAQEGLPLEPTEVLVLPLRYRYETSTPLVRAMVASVSDGEPAFVPSMPSVLVITDVRIEPVVSEDPASP